MSISRKLENGYKIIIKEIKEEEKILPRVTKEEIDKYFDTLNENKILGWESKLCESKLSIRDFSSVTDADILSEEFTDKKTAKIIKGDIERTKVMESIYMDNFKDYLYQFIIYYLNKNNYQYLYVSNILKIQALICLEHIFLFLSHDNRYQKSKLLDNI